MNSIRLRIGVFCVALMFLLGANPGRGVEFCVPNSQNNYCQQPPPPPDTTPPTIAISQLKEAKALKVPSVTLTGTAFDARGVVSVKFRVENYYGNSDYQDAQGTGSWTATVSGLAGGPNTIRIQAVDGAGNTNEMVQSVFYIQKLPLVLNVTGKGSATPNFAAKNIQVGQFYTMTAQPAKGYAFANWSGDQAGNSATLQFLMLTNTVLQANFVPTPFASAAGTYQGVITPLISGPPELGGSFKAKITKTGKFTAKVQLGSKTYSLLGTLSSDGSYSGSISRKHLSSVNVQLQLDVDGQTLNGSFTDLAVSQDPTGAVSARIEASGN